MLPERCQESRGSARVARERTPPCVDERSEQPRPNRTLMVGGIAAAQVAVVLRLVVGMLRAQGAQTERRQKLVANRFEYRLPTTPREHRMRQ